MPEIFFYHLTRSPVEQVLPDLLERVLSRKWRAVVRAVDTRRLEFLEKKLWASRDDGFLPNGLAGGPHDSAQPVLLTTGNENANLADVLLLVDGARTTSEECQNYERVCLLFDGNNEDTVAAARQDWKDLTDAGIPAQYWAQDDGSWVKKAEKTAG